MKKDRTPEFSLKAQQKKADKIGIKDGLIVAHHGVAVEVLFNDGERRMVRSKRNSGHVVGDDVSVMGEVLERLPRRTELRRKDARGGIHLVAANLDVLGIVLAPLSPASFIDRAIVAARAAGLIPFLVINKCDLENTKELVSAVNTVYADCVKIFPLSAATQSGLDPLKDFLSQGHRGVFVGNSGVGKSSLLNAICPEIDLKVGEINLFNGLGRHTTTVSTLHSLASGGELVDTPGFRDFGLVEISVEDLAEHFPGFEEHRNISCKFRNCRHRTEPGCSVVELVKSGRITQERYETYLNLLDEVEAAETETRNREWSR